MLVLYFDLVLSCCCLLLLTKCVGLVFLPDFEMLFFVYSQSVLVLCFDLVLRSYCLLLLTKCDCLVFDLVL